MSQPTVSVTASPMAIGAGGADQSVILSWPPAREWASTGSERPALAPPVKPAIPPVKAPAAKPAGVAIVKPLASPTAATLVAMRRVGPVSGARQRSSPSSAEQSAP